MKYLTQDQYEKRVCQHIGVDPDLRIVRPPPEKGSGVVELDLSIEEVRESSEYDNVFQRNLMLR